MCKKIHEVTEKEEDVRALRNTGDEAMVMMCIQYEAKPIASFMDDANIIHSSCRQHDYVGQGQHGSYYCR